MSGMRRRKSNCVRGGGFTLIEAMIVLVVLSIVAVGAAVGLQSTVKVPVQTDRTLVVSSELTSELENWRAAAFGNSPWPTTLPYSNSDTVTLSISGRQVTCSRTTSIQKWDPNNLTSNTAPQDDFVRVQVVIDGQSMECYLSKPL
jgi:prepilin-type N-terminal cleavage/methylation domain-containing protein